MMKKTLLTAAFVSSMSLLTACSESSYTPAVGQQPVNTGQYPTNGTVPPGGWANNPGTQPVLQPGQTLPPPGANGGVGVNANANWQFRLSTFNDSCIPVIYTRAATSCIRNGCQTVRVRRRVRLQSCNCVVERLVVMTTTESTNIAAGGSINNDATVSSTDIPMIPEREPIGGTRSSTTTSTTTSTETVTTVRNADGTVTTTRSTGGNTRGNNQPDPTLVTQETGRVNNRDGSETRVLSDKDVILEREQNKDKINMPSKIEFPLKGEDARAIYDHMELKKTGDDLRKRGRNIECWAAKKNWPKPDDIECWVSVQLQPKVDPANPKNTVLDVGDMPVYNDPKTVANNKDKAKKGLGEAYPEKNDAIDPKTHKRVKFVEITKGKEGAKIFFKTPEGDNINDPLHQINILVKMPGKVKSPGFANDDDTGEAYVRESRSLKCYLNLEHTYNRTECFVRINVRNGSAMNAAGTETYDSDSTGSQEQQADVQAETENKSNGSNGVSSNNSTVGSNGTISNDFTVGATGSIENKIDDWNY